MGVLLLGSVSAVLGVLYALGENDLKRLLAFSTIENGGIALMALGAGMIGLAAGRPRDRRRSAWPPSLYHVLNHAAFKGLLFLGAGGVVAATGTRRIEDLGGLVHRMPCTAGLFLLGSAAIAGLPLLNGFASEWLVFQSLLRGFSFAERLTRIVLPLGGALLALTSALAAACFVKAFALTLPRPAPQPRGGGGDGVAGPAARPPGFPRGRRASPSGSSRASCCASSREWPPRSRASGRRPASREASPV